jgi:predicted amidohydrolase YtcJ
LECEVAVSRAEAGGGEAMKRLVFGMAMAVLTAGMQNARGQVPAELISYPQTILQNGKILTVDDSFSTVEALAIRDGVILATGTSQQVLRLRGPETQVVDLQGRTVIPGFIATDGDGAPVADAIYKETSIGGQVLGTQELKTKTEIVEYIRKQVAEQPAGEPIYVRVTEEQPEPMKMTKADLDPVSPNHPVAISVSSFDMVVNSRMLTKALELIPGGAKHPSVIKDPATGQPNGQLFGHAMGVVGWDLRPWPKITEDTIQEQKRLFTRRNRAGQTSIVGHTHGFGLSVMNILYHRGEMTVRYFAAHDLLRANPNAEAYLRRLGNIVDFGLGDMVTIIGAGLSPLDGNAGPGSALTLLPKQNPGKSVFPPNGHNVWYSYGTSRGDINREQTEWKNLQVAIKYGWNTTSIHNVGDMATQLWLDGIEQGLGQPDLVMRPQFRPFGSDHNLFSMPEQYDQIKRLDFRRGLGKFQSGGAADSAELYGDRIHDVQPVTEFIRQGMAVHLEGADFGTLEQYITRRDERGLIWGPDYAVDRPTALRMGTIWAARYIGEEKNLGSLEPGKKADLVVLGEDYLTVPAERISEIPVVATLVGGKVVYGSL